MNTQPFNISHDETVFDFSGLPLSPLNVARDTYRNDRIENAAPEALDLGRKFLPWVAAQVAAAIGLGTCLAQAMPPVPVTVVIADHTHFALRLSASNKMLAPLPSGLQDGFRLRFGSNE